MRSGSGGSFFWTAFLWQPTATMVPRNVIHTASRSLRAMVRVTLFFRVAAS
jgi:hypothetical protein